MLVGFFSFGFGEATRRYYFEYEKNEGDLRLLINTSICFLLFAMAISIIPCFFLKDFLSKLFIGSSEFGLAVFIAFVGCWLSSIVTLYLSIFRNREDAKSYSFYTLLLTIMGSLFTVVLVVFFKLGYMGLIYPYFLSSLITFFFLFFVFARKYPPCFSYKMLVDNFKFGIQLLPTGIIGSIYNVFDRYLLSIVISVSSAGIFSIAKDLSNKVFVFMAALQATYDPVFMRDIFHNERTSGPIAVGRNFTVFSYIAISIVLVSSLFAEEIIHILMPKSYYESINVLIILLCGIATQTFGMIVGSQLAYAKKMYLSFPITVIGLIINVLLNIILIPRYEAAGAALAASITIIIMNYIMVRVAQKYYKIVYEAKYLFLLYLIFFISASLLIFLQYIESGMLWKYLVKLSSIIFFIILGIKVGIVSSKNVGEIIKMMNYKKSRSL